MKAVLVLLALLVLSSNAVWAKTTTNAPASSSTSSHKKSIHGSATTSTHGAHTRKASSKHKKGAWKKHGQQSITSDRTREIQQALIRAHYLDGEPSGQMDARTKAALQKMQQENGWQTKVLPDSRALIKLGLGPNHSDLINPDTAAVASSATIKSGGDPGSGPQR